MKAATLISPQAVAKRRFGLAKFAQPAANKVILLRVRALRGLRTDLHYC